jgi:hypothetical protein
MQILVSEDRRIDAFRQGDRPSTMTEQQFREKIRDEDALFLRFLTTKFRTRQPLALQIAHGMDTGQVQRQAAKQSVRETKDEEVIADMGFLSSVLGALPDDETLVKLRIHFRVPLNGYIYAFARFWSTSLWFQERDEDGEMEPCAIMEKAPELSTESVRGLPPKVGVVCPMFARRARLIFEQALQADVLRELEDKSDPALVFHTTNSPECDLPPPEGWTDCTRLGP